MKQLNRWVYAIVGIIVLLLVGMVYAWSVMSKSIAAAFPKWSMGQLSLTFTITMAMFCVGCLLAGILAKKVKSRIYIILAAVLLLCGFLLTSVTTSLPMLYLGFGVLCGMGAGFSYNAVMSTMSAWFPDKQGLISGILLMGFGLSSFIIGKIFAAITPSDGSDVWRSTFRVLGILTFIVLIVASFFFVKPGADFKVPEGKKPVQLRQPALDINAGQMVHQPSFWMYYVWAIVLSAAGLVLVSQAAGIAGQVGTGISDGTIATVVGLISILNGIGRVFFGAVFDKKGYRFTMILDMIIFIVAAVILILALSGGQFAGVVAGFVIGGFAYGGVMPTNSAIISDFFGRTNFPMNFSLINTNLIIASVASTIAGKLYDSTQSYMSALIMLLGLVIAGVVVSFGIRRPKEKA